MSHVGALVLLGRTTGRGKAGRARTTVERGLSKVPVPAPGTRDDLLALVSKLHEKPLDQDGPGWEAYAVTGLADGAKAYYVKTDLATGDGVSALHVLDRLLDGAPDHLAAGPRSELDVVSRWVEEALADPVGALLLVPRGLSRLAETPPVAGLPGMATAREVLGLLTGVLTGLVTSDPIAAGGALPTPSTRLDVVPTDNRRIALGSVPTSRLRQLEDLSGLGTTDVAVLVLARALRSWLLDHDALPGIPLVAAVPSRDPLASGNTSVHLVRRPLPTHLGTTGDRLAMVTAAAAMDPVTEPDLGSIGLTAEAVRRLAGPAGFNVLLQVLTSEGAGAVSAVGPKGVFALGPVDDLTGALSVTVTTGPEECGIALVACREVVPDVTKLMGYLEGAVTEAVADLADEA